MIMNEKEKVESLIQMGGFSPLNNYHEVRLIIRYLINEKKMTIKEDIIEAVDGILKDKMEDYFPWDWEDRITSYVDNELKNKTELAQIDNIYITQEEIDIIKNLKTVPQRKLLFSYIAYARYNSIKSKQDKEWVGRDIEEIFKTANLNNISIEAQDEVLADLYDMELISLDYKVDSLAVKVNCLHNDGDIVMWVNSFEDLGNLIDKYIKITYEGYKVCERCGKPYKPKSNRNKYCNSCAKIVKNEQIKEIMKKKRSAL